MPRRRVLVSYASSAHKKGKNLTPKHIPADAFAAIEEIHRLTFSLSTLACCSCRLPIDLKVASLIQVVNATDVKAVQIIYAVMHPLSALGSGKLKLASRG